MAQKAYRSDRSNKKEKGTSKKNKPQTDYQRERDAAKGAKKRKHNRA